MDHDFWRARWRENRIGFHQDEPTPLLVAHRARLPPAPARVFLPMCGKSEDLAYLSACGHPVVGVELVRDALEAFFRAHALHPAVREVSGTSGAITEFVAAPVGGGPITLYAGDMFALDPERVGRFEAIFDRAALIAWPPAAQDQHLAYLARLLAPGGRLLLVTFHYDQARMDGPPFSVSPARVATLWAPHGSAEHLETRDAMAPRFRERGLTWAEESAFLLTTRGP